MSRKWRKRRSGEPSTCRRKYQHAPRVRAYLEKQGQSREAASVFESVVSQTEGGSAENLAALLVSLSHFHLTTLTRASSALREFPSRMK